ncbi:hypothetical protein Nepgr_018245 [Nepenthes gracilis]|uniref:Uncharacterized protein n=1 Tax=Nepenthes gracilis TaxID=150966 RepID=A0AAD3ST20_NEPGR|nr:hypothetical protein Nepgr_018245 [Nepenthes gracilis]
MQFENQQKQPRETKPLSSLRRRSPSKASTKSFKGTKNGAWKGRDQEDQQFNEPTSNILEEEDRIAEEGERAVHPLRC